MHTLCGLAAWFVLSVTVGLGLGRAIGTGNPGDARPVPTVRSHTP